MNFQKKETFTSEVIEAAIKRLKDIDNYDFKQLSLEKKALDFAKANPSYYPYIPSNLEIFNSFKKNLSLKNLKYFVNLLNVRTEKLESQTSFYNEYIYSLIKELENESLNLEAATEEKRIKFFKGGTLASFNNFSKDSSFGLKFSNKDFLLDFKTKKIFKENEICSTIKNLGLSLPIVSKIKIPIVDIEVINEETTSGENIKPLRESPTSNLVDRNKSYHYSVIFRKSDKKRKYPIEHAELTLRFQLGSKMPINNIKISSSSTNPFEMEEMSYIDSNGDRIKINEVSVDGTFESNYIFNLIETETLFLKFKQVTPVGFSVLKSEKEKPLDKILRTSNLISGSSEEIEDIEGYVYDISLNEVEVNLLTYGERGIFRSEFKEISNATSMNIKESSIIPSAIALSQSYLQEYLILSDDVLIEKYLGLKFFNSDGSVLFNDIVPLIDNDYKQTEYLDGNGNQMRLKLFPMMFSKYPENFIKRIDEVEVCIDIIEEVEEDRGSSEISFPPEIVLTSEVELVDESYTNDYLDELLEEVRDWINTGIDRQFIEKIIVDSAIRDISAQNIAETINQAYITGNGGYGVIDIRDFIIDDSFGTLTGLENYVNSSIPLDIYIGYEFFIPENGIGKISLVDPTIGFNVNLVKPSNVPMVSKWNINSMVTNYSNSFLNGKMSSSVASFINTNRINLYSYNPNTFTSTNSFNSYNKSEEDIENSLIENQSILENKDTQNCSLFYQIEFEYDHGFIVGEHFEFFIPEDNYILTAIVSKIIDSKTILVPKSFCGSLNPSILGRELLGENYFQLEDSSDYIEIFEEARKLKIGEDYLLSPDNGSTWYSQIPLDVKITFIANKAKAGDFLVKIKKFDKNKLYIGKYFVNPYQSLSKDNKIVLKNKRLEIQSPLSESEGVASAILVMRNGFKNRYLSPIIYEYTMYGYEDKPQAIKKGLLYNKSLKDKKKAGNINVN